MARDYTPGEAVTVVSMYCGWPCNDQFNGAFDGVVGERASEHDYGCMGPTPLYHVRQPTCQNCGETDLYAEDGGAVYSHIDLIPANLDQP